MKSVKNPARILSLVIAMLLMLTLCACGAKNASADTASETAENSEPQKSYKGEQGYPSDGTSVGTAGKTSDDKATDTKPSGDKIIYTGSADIETRNFEQTLADIEKLVSEAGGFIQSSSVHDNDFYTAQYGGTTYRSAYYELRIPVEKFDSVMNGLSSLGNVPYSSVDAENITEQYMDTEARLTSRKAEEARLLELLANADTVEEMLQIESHLSDVRYEIETLTSQIKNWDSRISYSTLTLNVSEVSLFTEDTPAAMSYGRQLATALKSSAKSVWRFLKNLLKGIVAALPVLAAIAVVAVPVFFIVRRVIRRKKSKKTNEAESNLKE